MSENTPTYRFGPRERNGPIGGLRTGQVVVLAVGLVSGWTAFVTLPFGTNAVVCLSLMGLAAAVTWLPIGKRNLDEWLRVIFSFAMRKFVGEHRWFSHTHLQGHVLDAKEGVVRQEVPLKFRPPGLKGVEILAASVEPMSGEMGVLREGKRFTAMIEVRGPGTGTALMDPGSLGALAQGWAGIVASYGITDTPISRLEWIEKTMPEDPGALLRYARERIPELGEARTSEEIDAILAALSPERRSCIENYLKGCREGGPVAQQHECYLVLQIDTGSSRMARQLKRLGKGDVNRGACEVLMRQLASLAENLEAIDVAVVGALTPRLVAQHIRFAYDPTARARRSRLEQAGADEGEEPLTAGPRAQQEFLDHLRTDGACHSTYHVTEWPRTDVRADFLNALLLNTSSPRTVALVMEPVPPRKAQREIQNTHWMRQQIRREMEKRHFDRSFERKHQDEKVEQVGEEITVGHVNVRFSAYVTVTALNPDDLYWARANVEERAAESQLALELLYGQQAAAFSYTLPLGRGLA